MASANETQRSRNQAVTQCLILAGGLGTRMSGMYRKIPKALVPVGTRTFVEWQLEWLRLCGVTDVVLAVGHLGELLRTHLEQSAHAAAFPSIQYSSEGDVLLGTGGAIKKARALLDEEFLVTYGDSFLFLNAKALLAHHRSKHAAVTFSIYGNDNCYDRSNVEYRDGRIVSYDKCSPTSEMRHIDYGMFALNREMFLSDSPDGRFDVADYLHTVSIEGRMEPYLAGHRFYEGGSPEGYRAFCEFLASHEFQLARCLALIEHPHDHDGKQSAL